MVQKKKKERERERGREREKKTTCVSNFLGNPSNPPPSSESVYIDIIHNIDIIHVTCTR